MSPSTWLATSGIRSSGLVEPRADADRPKHDRQEAVAEQLLAVGVEHAAGQRQQRTGVFAGSSQTDRKTAAPARRRRRDPLASAGASAARGSTGSSRAARNRSSLVPK